MVKLEKNVDIVIICYQLLNLGVQQQTEIEISTKKSFFTQGQFWPSGIVVAVVCLSVCPSVCAVTTCLSA